MKLFLKSKARKAGAAPGLLVSADIPDALPAKLAMHRYSPDSFEIAEDVDLDEALRALEQAGNVWLDLSGLNDLVLVQNLGSALGIHPLVLEDMVSPGTGQRWRITGIIFSS